MWKIPCEISHVKHMWKVTCEISHVKHLNYAHVFHMWKITCVFGTSHVIHMCHFCKGNTIIFDTASLHTCLDFCLQTNLRKLGKDDAFCGFHQPGSDAMCLPWMQIDSDMKIVPRTADRLSIVIACLSFLLDYAIYSVIVPIVPVNFHSISTNRSEMDYSNQVFENGSLLFMPADGDNTDSWNARHEYLMIGILFGSKAIFLFIFIWFINIKSI